MCKFIAGSALLPGWVCCRCRTYNGLQRCHCRACKEKPHEIEVPATVVQCANCGCGLPRGARHTRTLAGRDVRGKCPACGAAWPEESAQGMR